MSTKAIIGNIIGGHWVPLGIQCVTDAAGPQVLSLPTNGVVQFATFQATVTTWAFSDITTVSPTAANCQVINPNLHPMVYAGDLTKIQIWCTTAAAKLLVHYYK